MRIKTKSDFFICKGLPDFEKFTPEIIQNEFPKVLNNLENDFNDIQAYFEKLLTEEKLDWDQIMMPLNKINEELRWSWGVISHLNAVNNSESLRDVYSKFLPEVIKLGNKIGQSKVIYKALIRLKDTNVFDITKNRILDKEILDMEHSGISLEDADQKRFNQNSERLGDLSTKFSNNVLDANE